MVKYCGTRQHQLNCLSHMREGACDMYMKIRAESWVPQLEKELGEVWLKLVELSKECNKLAV